MRTLLLFALAAVMAGRLFPAGAAEVRSGIPAPPAGYGFYVGKGDILVSMTPSPKTDVFLGRELAFYNGSQKVCVPLDGAKTCPQKFVGSVRTVVFKFTATSGELSAGLVLREKVTLVRQSAGLPEREVFEKVVPVVAGTASDIQLWGYDEASIPKAEAKETRKEFLGTWREFRQELFLGDSRMPFAVVVWRQSPSSIEILDSQQVHDPDALAAATMRPSLDLSKNQK